MLVGEDSNDEFVLVTTLGIEVHVSFTGCNLSTMLTFSHGILFLVRMIWSFEEHMVSSG